MFILIEYKRSERRVSIIGLENIPQQWVQSQAKQRCYNNLMLWDTIQLFWKIKADLFTLLCLPHAGRQCEQSLKLTENGVKTSAFLGMDEYNFGKCSFWKRLHRLAGNMSNVAPQGPASFLWVSILFQACWAHRLRVSFEFADKGQVGTLPPEFRRENTVYKIQVLPSYGSCNNPNSSVVLLSSLLPLNA